MPNINEFLSAPKPEVMLKAELEKIEGIKPCSKCNKDADFAYWDAATLELSWTCPDGHENKFKVN